MGKVVAGLACGALAAGAMVLVAPGSGAAGGGRSVSIQQHQFTPKELTVNVGDEVTWTHRDGDQTVHRGPFRQNRCRNRQAGGRTKGRGIHRRTSLASAFAWTLAFSHGP